ncbi:hypothetical protein N2152v2_000099 [Parachlorella kessleri]
MEAEGSGPAGVASPLEPSTLLPPEVNEILAKARSSWLKNNEVLELLQGYQDWGLFMSSEAPQQPTGGQLYLFNKNECRFFRKDGINWKKKPDGKTVRETHEKLKVGDTKRLNCYYAHADQEDGLQRRCYWMLEESQQHIVLVHYLNCLPARNEGQPTGRRQRQRQRAGRANVDASQQLQAFGGSSDLEPPLDFWGSGSLGYEGAVGSGPMGSGSIPGTPPLHSLPSLSAADLDLGALDLGPASSDLGLPLGGSGYGLPSLQQQYADAAAAVLQEQEQGLLGGILSPEEAAGQEAGFAFLQQLTQWLQQQQAELDAKDGGGGTQQLLPQQAQQGYMRPEDQQQLQQLRVEQQQFQEQQLQQLKAQQQHFQQQQLQSLKAQQQQFQQQHLLQMPSQQQQGYQQPELQQQAHFQHPATPQLQYQQQLYQPQQYSAAHQAVQPLQLPYQQPQQLAGQLAPQGLQQQQQHYLQQPLLSGQQVQQGVTPLLPPLLPQQAQQQAQLAGPAAMGGAGAGGANLDDLDDVFGTAVPVRDASATAAAAGLRMGAGGLESSVPWRANPRSLMSQLSNLSLDHNVSLGRKDSFDQFLQQLEQQAQQAQHDADEGAAQQAQHDNVPAPPAGAPARALGRGLSRQASDFSRLLHQVLEAGGVQGSLPILAQAGGSRGLRRDLSWLEQLDDVLGAMPSSLPNWQPDLELPSLPLCAPSAPAPGEAAGAAAAGKQQAAGEAGAGEAVGDKEKANAVAVQGRRQSVLRSLFRLVSTAATVRNQSGDSSAGGSGADSKAAPAAAAAAGQRSGSGSGGSAAAGGDEPQGGSRPPMLLPRQLRAQQRQRELEAQRAEQAQRQPSMVLEGEFEGVEEEGQGEASEQSDRSGAAMPMEQSSGRETPADALAVGFDEEDEEDDEDEDLELEKQLAEHLEAEEEEALLVDAGGQGEHAAAAAAAAMAPGGGGGEAMGEGGAGGSEAAGQHAGSSRRRVLEKQESAIQAPPQRIRATASGKFRVAKRRS